MSNIIRVRQDLLHQLLNLPQLVTQIQQLNAESFHRVIDRIGLEDSGELIAMANTKQLTELFDIDLWSNNHPGDPETFNGNRFAAWLEVLWEAGESVLLDKISDMDRELMVYGLASQVFVYRTVELDTFFHHESAYTQQLDLILESCLYEELNEFHIFSRNPESWDVVFSLLLALDKEDHLQLNELMNRLADAGDAEVEENDLLDVLTEIEAMAENLADKRDIRRTTKGYISSQDARAFLRLAEHLSIDELTECSEADPITKAYFRMFTPDVATDTESRMCSKIIDILDAEDVYPSSTAIHGYLPGSKATNQTLLLISVQKLNAASQYSHSNPMYKLQYLGNVVVAGATLNGRRFRAFEASAAVAATCALGIEAYAFPAINNVLSPEVIESALRAIELERFFLLGWRLLGAGRNNEFPFKTHNPFGDTYEFIDTRQDLPIIVEPADNFLI